METKKITKGIVLSGGGAKGAIESGVLKYIIENFGLKFDVVIGNSAGALNAFLYSNLVETGSSEDADINCKKITAPWEELNVADVAKIPFKDYFFGNFTSILDNIGLKNYINKYFSEDTMNSNIQSGKIKVVGVITSELQSGKAHLWYKSHEKDVDMSSSRWISHKKDYLTHNYAVASAAIPVVFKPENLKAEGGIELQSHDGGVRMNTPLNPLFKSGAEKILVLYLGNADEEPTESLPNMIDSFYGLINTFFFKNLEEDIIRAKTINDLLSTLGKDEFSNYRKVDVLVIRPKINIDNKMVEIIKNLNTFTKLFAPRGLIKFLSVSALFMDKIYTKPLVDLGYDLAQSHHDDLVKFFDDNSPVTGKVID